MPSNYKSPYASAFQSAVKRGTPSFVAVQKIATRHNKSPRAIYQSLHKAGLCFRQKFNGQWLYWPCDGRKSSATTSKECQYQIWQHLIDWCIASGHCKPEQLDNQCGSQKDFMEYCRKFFTKQFSGASSSKPRSSPKRSASRRLSSVKRRRPSGRSYKFPNRSSSTRRYRRAA